MFSRRWMLGAITAAVVLVGCSEFFHGDPTTIGGPPHSQRLLQRPQSKPRLAEAPMSERTFKTSPTRSSPWRWAILSSGHSRTRRPTPQRPVRRGIWTASGTASSSTTARRSASPLLRPGRSPISVLSTPSMTATVTVTEADSAAAQSDSDANAASNSGSLPRPPPLRSLNRRRRPRQRLPPPWCPYLLPTPSPTATTTTPPIQGETIQATIQNFRHQDLTVQVGDTIVWTQQDQTTHTTTSGTPGNLDGVWDSEFLNNSQTFSFTFTEAGASIHP